MPTKRGPQYELHPDSILSELIAHEKAKLTTIACQRCINKRMREMGLAPPPKPKPKPKPKLKNGNN